MKALVYLSPGKRALENIPEPDIKSPTDAIVRITKTPICGTDLHVMKSVSNQASSTLRTEEQILSEELLENDSLGG